MINPNHKALIKKEETVQMPTAYGDFEMTAYRQSGTEEVHLALTKGAWLPNESVLVRLHSSCITGDIFGSCRCDCGEQLHASMQRIEKEGNGVVLYLFQEGRGIGLVSKLKAYKLQENGLDTVEANLQLGFKEDERDYQVAAQMLQELGIHKIRLMTNNPQKKEALTKLGIEVSELIAIEIPANAHNQRYLRTKRDKMGHTIK